MGGAWTGRLAEERAVCRLQCRGAEQEGGDIAGQTQATQRHQVVRTGGAGRGRRVHGLTPCSISVLRPAWSKGSPPDTLNTHSPTSFYFLSLTS